MVLEFMSHILILMMSIASAKHRIMILHFRHLSARVKVSPKGVVMTLKQHGYPNPRTADHYIYPADSLMYSFINQMRLLSSID
jgi:hypothetical protein